MKLIVNGEEQMVKAETLIDLLAELQFEADWLATAVNSDLVAAEDRTGFKLSDGDKIEVLAPMQGG